MLFIAGMRTVLLKIDVHSASFWSFCFSIKVFSDILLKEKL